MKNSEKKLTVITEKRDCGYWGNSTRAVKLMATFSAPVKSNIAPSCFRVISEVNVRRNVTSTLNNYC